jgi:hypothetical protein
MGFIFIFIVASGVISFFVWASKKEAERLNAMSPEERNNALWGIINPHLICVHCQSQGTVHTLRVARSVVSTGTVGGILKTNTQTTTVVHATQHHCDKCSSTWDI